MCVENKTSSRQLDAGDVETGKEMASETERVNAMRGWIFVVEGDVDFQELRDERVDKVEFLGDERASQG